VAGEVEISKSSIEELASMMVGKHFDFSKSYPKYSYPEKSEPSLKIKDLIRTDAHKKTLQNISMQVFKGEVVGIAGVEGNGQSELIKTLLGIHESHENLVGSIELLNQEILHKSTEEILQQDIAYLPEDRLHQGLLLESNLVDNFFLTHHQKPTWIKNGLIQWNLIREQLQKLLIKFDVRPATSQNLAKSYSGGNQQKFVIARELSKNPKFLLATQPTRGVDIGAIQFIHDQIMDFRDKGCAVLLISSELDELLKLSDRILVLFDGKIVGEFNKENFNEFEIGKLMGGAL
jgi:simple sugar transport system ATP-binding protein